MVLEFDSGWKVINWKIFELDSFHLVTSKIVLASLRRWGKGKPLLTWSYLSFWQPELFTRGLWHDAHLTRVHAIAITVVFQPIVRTCYAVHVLFVDKLFAAP